MGLSCTVAMVLFSHHIISVASGLSVASLSLRGAEKAEFIGQIHSGIDSIVLLFQAFIIFQSSLSDEPDNILIGSVRN